MERALVSQTHLVEVSNNCKSDEFPQLKYHKITRCTNVCVPVLVPSQRHCAPALASFETLFTSAVLLLV